MKTLQTLRYTLIISAGVAAGIVIGDFWRPSGHQARYALMERNAVIVDAVFGEGIKDDAKLTRIVLEPIRKTIDDYTAKGFVIIDVTSDTSCQQIIDLPQSQRCGYTLLGIPNSFIDITADLRKAVDEAKKIDQTKDQK